MHNAVFNLLAKNKKVFKKGENLLWFEKLKKHFRGSLRKDFLPDQKALPKGIGSSDIKERIIGKAIKDLTFESLLRSLADVDWVLCPQGKILNIEAEYKRIHTKRWQKLERYAEALCLSLAERIALPGEDTLRIAQWLSYNIQSLVRQLDSIPRPKHTFVRQTRAECEAVWTALKYLGKGQIPPKFVREDTFFALSKWWFVIIQPVAMGMGWWRYRPVLSAWNIFLMALFGTLMVLQGVWIKWLLRNPKRISRIDRVWIWRGEEPESLFRLHASADVISGLGIGVICYLIGGFAATSQSWYSLILAACTALLVALNIFSKFGLRRGI